MLLTEREAKGVRCQESYGPLYVTEEGGEVHLPFIPSFATVSSPGVVNSVSAFGGTYAVTVPATTSNGHNMPTVASPSHCIGSKCMAWRWAKLTDECAWGADPSGYCGKAGKP